MVDNNEDNIVFNNEESYMTFNVKTIPTTIPTDFMTDASVCQQLHARILELESSNRSQAELNKAYKSLCTIIIDEMKLKLPYKYINAPSSYSNKTSQEAMVERGTDYCME